MRALRCLNMIDDHEIWRLNVSSLGQVRREQATIHMLASRHTRRCVHSPSLQAPTPVVLLLWRCCCLRLILQQSRLLLCRVLQPSILFLPKITILRLRAVLVSYRGCDCRILKRMLDNGCAAYQFCVAESNLAGYTTDYLSDR